MNIAWRAARVTDSQALAGEFADHRELDRRTESLTVNVHGPFVLDDMDITIRAPSFSLEEYAAPHLAGGALVSSPRRLLFIVRRLLPVLPQPAPAARCVVGAYRHASPGGSA
jgi:hypothetical protein